MNAEQDASTLVLHEAVTALRELILAGETYRRAAAERVGVSGTDSQAMSYLITRGPMQPTELAEAIGMAGGSITSVVDHLCERGLVERVAHPTDRRRSIVQPSREGQAVFDAARGWLADVIAELPSEDWPELLTTMRTLSAALRRRAVTVADEPLPTLPGH